MSAPYVHIKEFVEDLGIDLRSSEVLRQYPFLTNSQNTMPSPQGAASTRYGTHLLSSGYGKFGIVKFETVSLLGVAKTEIIGFGADSIVNSSVPYRLVNGTFTITNDHVSAAATVSMLYDTATSQFRLTLVVNGSTEVDQALGTGIEGSPYMLSSLETVVDAAASFSMSTPTSASTTPAAFMEILDAVSVASGASVTINYFYWQQINAPHGTGDSYATLKNYALEIGSDNYQNVSSVVIKNVLYMSSGTNLVATLPGGSSVPTAVITKYDGQNFYRAGMAEGFYPVIDDVSAGTYIDVKGSLARVAWSYDEQDYFCTFKQVDKAGNIVEGPPDANLISATPGASSTVIELELPSALTLHTTGFNTGLAVSTSTQGPLLTFGVDNGSGANHSLQVGDIAYFWDNGQGRFIQREITARTNSTITLSSTSLDTVPESPNYDTGANPSVRDDAIFSNNLRVVIWRQKADKTAYYLVDEVPYPQARTNFYYDEKTDSQLGAQYIEPVYPIGQPPQGRYLASYNNQLIVLGDDKNPDTVYFSDVDAENFPAATHNFLINGIGTGAHQNGDVLAVATKKTLDVADGDLLAFNFRLTRISSSVGCTSHASMEEVEEGILHFQTAKGPYTLVNGRSLNPLGAAPNSRGIPVSRLEPFFTRVYSLTEEQPCFKRATAGVLGKLNLYFLFVPFELPSKPGFATSNSVLWVYDYGRDSWRKWTGIGAAAGICEVDDVLHFSSRSHDGAAGVDFDNAVTRLAQQQLRKGIYNYSDHNNYIDVKHQYHWEALGEPSVFKKMISLAVMSHETRISATMPVTVKTYINYDATLISTNDVLTFTSQPSLIQKLKAEKCKSMMVSLESQEYFKPLVISGTELEAAAPFRQVAKE